jgi:hypothetical protein
MKKLFFSLLAGSALLLAGCFETIEEIELKDDGSGTFTTTNDLSAVIGVAKQMGGKEAEKMEDLVKDTTISMASMVDSVPSLTPDEKELVKAGTMRMNVDLKNDKFIVTMNFPFKKVEDIAKINKIAAKMMNQTLKEKLAGGEAQMPGEMPEPSSFESYFDIEYSKGKIVKKLNKEKYGMVDSDEYLKGMKEAGSMGIPINTTQVITLPRPAKKIDGKNVKLSDDKMKITVKASIDDFYDDPEKMEFKVEY